MNLSDFSSQRFTPPRQRSLFNPHSPLKEITNLTWVWIQCARLQRFNFISILSYTQTHTHPSNKCPLPHKTSNHIVLVYTKQEINIWKITSM